MIAYRKILQSAWPATLWSALIFILLILPGDDIPSEGLFSLPHLDKIVHVTLFGLLVSLWFFYFHYSQKKGPQTLIKIILVSIAYGIAMEFVQRYFVQNRSFDLYDILADAAGALLAGYIIKRKKL